MTRKSENEEPFAEPVPPAPCPLDAALEKAYAADEMEFPLSGRMDRREIAPVEVEGVSGSGEPSGELPKPSGAREADFDAIEESQAKRIANLPKHWQRGFVMALFRVGGVAALARRAVAAEYGGLSLYSIAKARREVPLFHELCLEAEEDGAGLVDGALLRGATIGDVQPVHQGGMLVGHKRVRCAKSAEIFYRRKGLMLPEEVHVHSTGRVEMVHTADVPAKVAAAVARLYGPQPAVIEAERLPS